MLLSCSLFNTNISDHYSSVFVSYIRHVQEACLSSFHDEGKLQVWKQLCFLSPRCKRTTIATQLPQQQPAPAAWALVDTAASQGATVNCWPLEQPFSDQICAECRNHHFMHTYRKDKTFCLTFWGYDWLESVSSASADRDNKLERGQESVKGRTQRLWDDHWWESVFLLWSFLTVRHAATFDHYVWVAAASCVCSVAFHTGDMVDQIEISYSTQSFPLNWMSCLLSLWSCTRDVILLLYSL